MELKKQLMEICYGVCAGESCNDNCPDYKYLETLLAEFDRLTAERNALDGSLKAAKQESDRYINIAYDNMIARDEAQAENERLEAELEIADRDYALALGWLRTISEPIKKAREEVASGKSWCGTFKYATESQQAVFAYLDSQQPSEKQEKTIMHLSSDYKLANCSICNPKHLCRDGIWEYFLAKDCVICNPPYVREMDSSLVVIRQPVLIGKYFQLD